MYLGAVLLSVIFVIVGSIAFVIMAGRSPWKEESPERIHFWVMTPVGIVGVLLVAAWSNDLVVVVSALVGVLAGLVLGGLMYEFVLHDVDGPVVVRITKIFKGFKKSLGSLVIDPSVHAGYDPERVRDLARKHQGPPR